MFSFFYEFIPSSRYSAVLILLIDWNDLWVEVSEAMDMTQVELSQTIDIRFVLLPSFPSLPITNLKNQNSVNTIYKDWKR